MMGRLKARFYWPVALAVMLTAAFFRFYRLADLPLGLFFDPAINGLDAIRLIERGGPVIFFPTNGGREAFFMYLLIPFIRVFGTIPFSIRAVTAIISLLSVVLLFGFLYDSRPALAALKLPHVPAISGRYRLWLAGLGGLALAASYWHISVSRLGQRPIMVPALSIPIFWTFLKGWYSRRSRWFLVSGLLLGLAGHTYSAARLVPLILALALLPEFLRLIRRPDRPPLKPLLVNLAIFAAAALVVYLPLAWYLLTHPAQFTDRAFSVMVWNFLDTPAEILAETGRNLLRVLGYFCCAGSPNPIFGLPDYPGLSPLLAPLLLAGLIGALVHSGHLWHRLVALWWLLGVTPSIVAIEAPHPWRMIVAVAPTAILIGLAPFYLIEAAAVFRRAGAITSSRWPLWLTLGLILLTIPGTFRAYFINWPALQVTRGIYDYGAIAIRDEVHRQAATGRPLYLPFSRFNDSTLLFYLSGSFERQAAMSVPVADQGALAISPEKSVTDATWIRLEGRTATLLPPLTVEGQQLLQSALAAASSRAIRTADGETVARLATLPEDPAQFLQQPDYSLSVFFGPTRLVGAAYDPVINPDTTRLPVTLFWQASRTMTEEYEVLLHLVDDQRRAWGNGDARPAGWVYPTTFWRPGQETIAAQQQLQITPGGLPPGRYWLAISLFNPATGSRLPVSQGETPSPDTFFLGPLKAPPAQPPVPAAAGDWREVGANFGDMAELAGYVPERLVVSPGEPVRFTLIWQALTAPDRDYTVFVHLLDDRDNLVAGNDTQPGAGAYPTSIWSPAELISDPHSLPTFTSTGQPLPPGQYRLAVGLYHQPTGERLPLRFPDGRLNPDGRLFLDRPVTITP